MHLPGLAGPVMTRELRRSAVRRRAMTPQEYLRLHGQDPKDPKDIRCGTRAVREEGDWMPHQEVVWCEWQTEACIEGKCVPRSEIAKEVAAATPLLDVLVDLVSGF